MYVLAINYHWGKDGLGTRIAVGHWALLHCLWRIIRSCCSFVFDRLHTICRKFTLITMPLSQHIVMSVCVCRWIGRCVAGVIGDVASQEISHPRVKFPRKFGIPLENFASLLLPVNTDPPPKMWNKSGHMFIQTSIQCTEQPNNQTKYYSLL